MKLIDSKGDLFDPGQMMRVLDIGVDSWIVLMATPVASGDYSVDSVPPTGTVRDWTSGVTLTSVPAPIWISSTGGLCPYPFGPILAKLAKF